MTVDEFKGCYTCKWVSDRFTSVCCNGNSRHRADFVDGDMTCDQWEERKETDDGKV